MLIVVPSTVAGLWLVFIATGMGIGINRKLQVPRRGLGIS